ncbi:MAG: AFG1 family ATPase [Alphaproteobacteria bacterium]|nr:AFG1 family ATPase [Alphaproteobacteria bacterium]
MGRHVNPKISLDLPQLDMHQQTIQHALETLQLELQQNSQMSLSQKLFNRLRKSSPLKGLYIYGSVGRGKTMLMDWFFHNLEIKRKKRYHFHSFMQKQVHQRLKEIATGQDSPIETLATEIAHKAQVLCFDEFHVCDIADAMILGRLFSRLFELGTVVVATSNQHPDGLYEGGLHRDRFLPFMDTLKEYCNVYELSGDTDYRRAILRQHKRYFYPLTPETDTALSQLFTLLSNGHKSTTENLIVKGRNLTFPCVANGIVRTTFKDLCDTNLGAVDYLSIVHHFHTIFLENIPVMDSSMHNQAKRFITLIDVIYDQGRNLVLSAEAEPDQLYKSGKNHEFFARTASRLIEMSF